MKVKSESEVAQSCPTLSDPMECSPPGSSVYGIFQARVPESGAIVFSTSAHNKEQLFEDKDSFLFSAILLHPRRVFSSVQLLSRVRLFATP